MAMSIDNPVLFVKDCLSSMLKQVECAICLEVFRDPVATRCGHCFCRQCIIKSLSGSKSVSCPLCKELVTRRGIKENFKYQNTVERVRGIVSAVSKCVGYDIMQAEVPKVLKESTREAFSPPDKCSASNTASINLTNSISKGSERIETWLQEVTPSSLSQESDHATPIVNLDTPESDSDFDSVSQVKPDSMSNATGSSESKNTTKSRFKTQQASADIEDDEGSVNVEEPVPHLTLLNKVDSHKKNRNLTKTSLLNKRPASKINFLKHSSSTIPPEISLDSEAPVDIGKENSTNVVTATRSPGWSRIKKMKMEFHDVPKSVLKTKNAAGAASPVPTIEEPGSGDDEPCLSLSLSSSSIRTRERINMIVNNLEVEIALCNRESSVNALEAEVELINRESSFENKSGRVPHVVPCGPLSSVNSNVRGIYKLPEKPQLAKKIIIAGKAAPNVTFLKLGNFTKHQSPKVPFSLKGRLLHIPSQDYSTHDCSRLSESKNVHTQYSPQNELAHHKDTGSFEFNVPEVPLLIADQKSKPIEGTQRRSDGAPSEVNTDFMDAETVVVSQPAQRNSPNESQPPTHFNEIPNRTVETVEDNTGFEDKSQPQPSKSQTQGDVSLFSFDNEEHILARTSNTEQLDLNDSSSSDFNGKKISKRIRTLSCSTDSSESDVGDRKSSTKVSKKRKTLDLSKSEESFQEMSPDLDVTLTNYTCLPDIEATIKANIEAGLKDTELLGPSDWYNPEPAKNISSPNSQKDVFGEQTDTDTQASRIEVENEEDSDAESATSVIMIHSRDTSQSDDIVPDSQPTMVDKDHTSLGVQVHHSVQLKNASPTLQGDPGPLQSLDKTVLSKPLEISTSKPSITMKSLLPKASDPHKNVPPTPTASAEKADQCILDNSTAKQQRCSFICSNLPASSVAEVQKLAQLMGGDFSSKYSANTTHLVVRVNSENAADKTLKYLCTVAAGKWVVSLQWVLDSLEAKKLLPEEPYEAVDSSGEPGPRRSRMAHKDGTKLLKNFEFYCLDDFPDISKSQMQDLLAECGGVIIEDPTKFSFADNVLPISLGVLDEANEAELIPWLEKYGSLLIQHDWVLDCIGKFALSSMYSAILCDAPEDLTSIGFPSFLVEPIDSEQ